MDWITPMFKSTVLIDQECFKSTKQWETLLELIPERSASVRDPMKRLNKTDIGVCRYPVVVEPLRKLWKADPDRSSKLKWSDLRDEVSNAAATNSSRPFVRLFFLSLSGSRSHF